MAEFDTLWGSFKNEDDPEIEQEEQETEEVEEEEEQEEKEKPTETKETEETEEKEEDEKNGIEDTESSELDIFNSVNDLLEEEELIFIDEDAKYDANAKGLAKMMRDNMEKYKEKLELDFVKKEDEIRKSYESSGNLKFSNMDPENSDQAEEMLKEYFKQTGFEDDEIEEKLKELKDLDTISKEAKIAKRYLSKKEEALDKAEKERKNQEEAERQSQIEEYIQGIKDSIDSTEEMAGFAMTNKIKKDFKNYLFEKDKDGKSKAQKANEDPNRRLKLAFLDFIEFNKKDFEIKAKTEVSNELKKKVSRFTNDNAKTKGKTIENEEPEETEEGFKKGFLNFWG
ncbi:hypothetical protein [Tenacibaculum sp.]|uniref:hypothetical protein n=1 Tax=Tenacibaculum sp. TaxID=1906242 RepID=UPI003D129186